MNVNLRVTRSDDVLSCSCFPIFIFIFYFFGGLGNVIGHCGAVVGLCVWDA